MSGRRQSDLVHNRSEPTIGSNTGQIAIIKSQHARLEPLAASLLPSSLLDLAAGRLELSLTGHSLHPCALQGAAPDQQELVPLAHRTGAKGRA